MELITNAQRILSIVDRIRGLGAKLDGLAEKRVQAEYDYQVANSKAYFLLRNKKYTQGDAKEYVKGIDKDLEAMLNVFDMPLVAELRLQRDLADALEDANKRALRAAETELSGCQSVQRDFKEL